MFFYVLLIYSSLSCVESTQIQVKMKLKSSSQVNANIQLKSKKEIQIENSNTNSDNYTIEAMKKIFNQIFTAEKSQDKNDNFSNLFKIPNLSSNGNGESNFKINGNVTLNVLENNINPLIENKQEENFDSFNEDEDLQKNVNANNIVQGVKLGAKSKLPDNIFADVKKFKISGKPNIQLKNEDLDTDNQINVQNPNKNQISQIIQESDTPQPQIIRNVPTVRSVDDFEAEIRNSKIKLQTLNPKVLNDVTIHNHYHVKDKSTTLVKPSNPNIFNLRKKQNKSVFHSDKIKKNTANNKPFAPSQDNFVKTKQSMPNQILHKTKEIDSMKMKDPNEMNLQSTNNAFNSQIYKDKKLSDNPYTYSSNFSSQNFNEFTNHSNTLNKAALSYNIQNNKGGHLIIPVNLNNNQLKKKWTIGETKDFNDYDYRKTIDYILNK